MEFNFQSIFSHLQSAEKIEHKLTHFYSQVEYRFNNYSIYVRNLPRFNFICSDSQLYMP
jgi:hypothetical protein